MVAAVLAAGGAADAYGQAASARTDAMGGASGGRPGSQQAVPAPLPPGSDADTPGGSARNGVIRPPATGDQAIRHTPPRTGMTPVIPPPGTNGDGNTVPK